MSIRQGPRLEGTFRYDLTGRCEEAIFVRGRAHFEPGRIPWNGNMRYLLSILCSSVVFVAHGQRIKAGNSHFWFSHWGDHRVHERWSLHSEFHIRRSALGKGAQQLLIRPAVNFHLHERVLLTVGYSYYENYRYGQYPIRHPNWEHHGFLQAQFTNEIGRVRMQHRYRWEHRWMARVISGPDGSGMFDGHEASDRFRYRIWVTVPIGKETPWTANAYNEFFLGIGSAASGNRFAQDRVSALLGYQANKELNVMAGYLFQAIDRTGAAMGTDVLEQNSTIHLVVVYNLQFGKRKSARKPLEG
jgi:Protein of unknown function (DUF2490)